MDNESSESRVDKVMSDLRAKYPEEGGKHEERDADGNVTKSGFREILDGSLRWHADAEKFSVEIRCPGYGEFEGSCEHTDLDNKYNADADEAPKAGVRRVATQDLFQVDLCPRCTKIRRKANAKKRKKTNPAREELLAEIAAQSNE